MKLILILALNILASLPILYVAMHPAAVIAIFNATQEGAMIPDALRRMLLLLVPAVLAISFHLSVRFRSVGLAFVSLGIVACAGMLI